MAAAELRLATVNLAHGRGTGAHQVITSTRALQRNLQGVGDWLSEVGADVACMQEADAPSWWSGRFDHVAAVARRAGHDHWTHGHHVRRLGLRYGTALSSRFALDSSMAHTFAPTPPTFSKGFTAAAMTWPGDSEFIFDVVSLHTDFARRSKRLAQVRELVTKLRARDRPVILAGDFNADWRVGEAVRLAAEALGLSTFEPEADMVTFPTTRSRLDWVLVSPEFELHDVQSTTWRLSDHRPLIARIGRR